MLLASEATNMIMTTAVLLVPLEMEKGGLYKMTRYDCNIMVVQYLHTTIYHGEPD